jgi:hypothetical protein
MAIGLVVSRVQVVSSAVTLVSSSTSPSAPIVAVVGRALAWMPAPVAHAASLAAPLRTAPPGRSRTSLEPSSAPHDDEARLQPDQAQAVNPQPGVPIASEASAFESVPDEPGSHRTGEPAATVPSNVENHPPSATVAAADLTGSADSAGSPPQVENKAITPWGALANTGVAVGRASQTAGVKTAGFFSRVGKGIARSF